MNVCKSNWSVYKVYSMVGEVLPVLCICVSMFILIYLLFLPKIKKMVEEGDRVTAPFKNVKP